MCVPVRMLRVRLGSCALVLRPRSYLLRSPALVLSLPRSLSRRRAPWSATGLEARAHLHRSQPPPRPPPRRSRPCASLPKPLSPPASPRATAAAARRSSHGRARCACAAGRAELPPSLLSLAIPATSTLLPCATIALAVAEPRSAATGGHARPGQPARASGPPGAVSGEAAAAHGCARPCCGPCTAGRPTGRRANAFPGRKSTPTRRSLLCVHLEKKEEFAHNYHVFQGPR